MIDALSLLYKRLTTSPEDKKIAREFVKSYARDDLQLLVINAALNAQRVADNLELVGEVQNSEKDIIYFDRATNSIRVKENF